VRRIAFPLSVVLALLAVACEAPADGPAAGGSSSSASIVSPPAASTTQEPSTSIEPAPPPAAIPAGVPATYDDDVPVRELPLDELIPPGDEITGVDRATTAGGEAVVISFATPGPDPLAQARGFVVWRRTVGANPPWRATYGVAHGKRSGVLAISAETTDLTGDGSADALIREETGGSGACATYRVVDLAPGDPLWKRSVCDAEIQPNPDPIGLFEVARIYGPEDAHCCPSSIRERVLTWDGDRFEVVSQHLTPI
jgi:hypothetical protein